MNLPSISISPIFNNDLPGVRIQITPPADNDYDYCVIEVQKNDDDYYPLSPAELLQYAYGYMEIRNRFDFNLAAVALGDVIRVRTRAYGLDFNITEWVESVPVTVTVGAYLPYEVTELSVEFNNEEEIVVEIE